MKIDNVRRRIIGLAGAALLTPVGYPAWAQAQAQTLPTKFRIGFQKGSATLVLARQRGSIEARLKQLGVSQVDWVEFQFGPPMLEAIGAGAVDLGSVGDTPPIFAQAGGADVVYAAATPSAEHGILVAKSSSIKTLADLRGKRIAFGKGSSAHNVVLNALRLAGLSYSDIRPVYLAPADASAAFVSGKVDAWAIWDPYYALAESQGHARVLTDTRIEPRLASHSFYIASGRFAEKYPDTLAAVLEELARTDRWSASHRGETARLAAEATGLSYEVQRRAFERARFEFGPVTDAILAQQQEIADAFLQQQLIPRAIRVRDIRWSHGFQVPKAA